MAVAAQRFPILPAAVLALLLAFPAVAAGQGTVQGEIRFESGTPAAGADVALLLPGDSVPLRVTVADGNGRFRFTGVEQGDYVVRSRPLGYAAAERSVAVAAGAVAQVELVLVSEAIALPGIGVAVTRERQVMESDAAATVRILDQEDIRRVPGVAEADVLRAVAVLPGVVTTSDYTSAYNVRGGSADQNLILLDGIPVYNPFHLGGVFGVFNADMVARTELYTGGFPASYGGRVASVLSVESDVGAEDAVRGGISLLAARTALAGRLPNGTLGLDRAGGRVSLRRSYFDQLLRPAFRFPYHLTDLQAFGEAWTRGGDRLTVTGYTGRDVLDLRNLEDFPLELRWSWGNDVVGGRWQRTLDAGALSATFGYTRFSTDVRFPEFEDTRFRSRMSHALARFDWEGRTAGLGLWLGAELSRLGYDNLAASGGTVFGRGAGTGTLLGGFAQSEIRTGNWLLELGARFDAWWPSAGDLRFAPAPRAAVKRFFRGGDLAVKLAAGRYTQFVHSLRDEEVPLGIDIWLLAGERAPHVTSDQVQGGVEGFLGGWRAGLETFYRTFDGVVAQNFVDDPDDPADDLMAGDGLGYGADAFATRDVGRFRPSIAVTWLRVTRTFPDLRVAAEPGAAPTLRYPPIFDRRLDVDLLLRADLSSSLEASARFHVGTGLPYTRPLGAYPVYEYGIGDGLRFRDEEDDDDPPRAVVLGPRNGERYPTYHRLDLSLRRTGPWRDGELTWYLEVLNVLNTTNVLLYFYDFDSDPPVRSGISMFPILPTIGVEFRF